MARSQRAPVTADDLERVVRMAVDVLAAAPAHAWDAKAGSLEWTCRETAGHLADDLFAYAAQLGPRRPPTDRYVPFAVSGAREGGPVETVRARPEEGPDGVLQVVEACGALLVAMVRTAPPHVLAYHGFGNADPEGFAAMGLVETLVHTHDLAEGLGLAWDPPADVCARVLDRLFPGAPIDAGPWPALLWATGRRALPGRPRLTEWRWYSAPRD
ncbi:maleylpyruvate isomerase N-terminal domain-containing protein [Actinomadura sp. ATCC 31491]|uniref:Maleylpyruvate isomerase N-terminal domain-containing protein n=1 Tax=Actinomadura luzonensis TaxID=2805427 RepID=A0ABT0FYK4_9ACTN|nr:maleylpyruvate isomerase N-terminal domain-containing protein [Actinomadura luzonensis]MCK2217431.1 maleylpyruvate isomerase N-terminal domain-containing protein [Actinomadura luzonensis]